MGKQVRQISARELVADVKAGVCATEILKKYRLSNKTLEFFLGQLVEKRVLEQSQVDKLLREAKKNQKTPCTSDERRDNLSGAAPAFQERESEVSRNKKISGLSNDAQDVGSSHQYSLKLYGSLSNDRDAFCRDLSAVLGIGVEQARNYLSNAPVTIKQGLSEEKAERLRSILVSIGALCLVNSPDVPEQASNELRMPLIDAVLAKAAGRKDSDSIWSRLKPSSAVLIGVLAFLSIGGVYLLSATAPVRERLPYMQSASKKESEPIKASVVDDAETFASIKSEIARLEKEVQEQISRLNEEKAAFVAMEKTVGVEVSELQKKNVQIKQLQDQIGQTSWELRSLRKKLNLMQRHLPQEGNIGESKTGSQKMTMGTDTAK